MGWEARTKEMMDDRPLRIFKVLEILACPGSPMMTSKATISFRVLLILRQQKTFFASIDFGWENGIVRGSDNGPAASGRALGHH